MTALLIALCVVFVFLNGRNDGRPTCFSSIADGEDSLVDPTVVVMGCHPTGSVAGFLSGGHITSRNDGLYA